MRIRPVLAVLPVAVLVVAGCSSEPPDDASPALAVQAERVADLLDGERPCRTVEALHLLEELGGADSRPAVRRAVMEFVLSARSTVSCRTGEDSPSPSPPPQEPAPQPEAPADPDPGPEEPKEPQDPRGPQPPGRDQPPGQDQGNGNGGNGGNGGKPGRGRGGGG